MERSLPEHNSSSQKRLSVNFLVSLMVHCARKANQFSKKVKLKQKQRKQTEDFVEIPKPYKEERFRWNWTISPLRSPRPKEFLTALSNRAMTMVGGKSTGYDGGFKPEKRTMTAMEGVWQREILMGGKCEPLDFSGVIYYDCSGRQLKELPSRSPRGTPLPNHPTRNLMRTKDS